MTSSPQDEVHDLLNKLQAPVENVDTLLAYLTAVLDSIGLLPPLFRKFNVQPLSPGTVKISRHIPQFQRVLLQHIVPTWDTVLKEKRATALLDQYFCPDSMSNASSAAGEVAISAYSTLLSTSPLSTYALHILERLSVQYPVDRLYTAVVGRTDLGPQAKELAWGDCVTNLVKVPGKVANALGLEGTIPHGLENSTFFNRMAVRVEALVSSLTVGKRYKDSLQYATYLFVRLVSQGLFPPTPPTTRSQPSFFQSTFPTIRSKLHASNQAAYFAYWRELLHNLPSTLALQSILVSLLGSLRTLEPPLSDSAESRALVREEAIILTELVGAPCPAQDELWEILQGIIFKRNWPLSHTRVFACWISGAAKGGDIDTDALDAFLQNLLELWAKPEHVKHSLLSQHQYLTSLLLLTASYFTVESQPMRDLSFNPSFIQGVSRYLGHQDASVRYCGMLVGEEIARMSGKSLQFGVWDGDDANKVWVRTLRRLIQARDVDANLASLDISMDPTSTPADDDTAVEELVSPAARKTAATMEEVEESEPGKVHFKSTAEGYDSDDSLAGYDSPPSSRSASPTPSELEEIEKDPTLNVAVKKVQRPVYLRQLGDLLRATGGQKAKADEPHEADKIEMALNCAEELIRKKRDYGTELAENAVNLQYALLALNNNYELEDFAAKRQGALNALVACAPRQTAPALIEEFFKNQYSVDQRYVILNALALGARELASLPVPESCVPNQRIAFPSKTLPPSQHAKYIAAGSTDSQLVPLLMDNISRKALQQQKAPEGTQNSPAIVREKVLRIKKTSGISELSRLDPLAAPAPSKRTTFTEVAAEYFIMPMINRFWLFLREEQMREERTAHMNGRGKYHGAGTGLILNPMVLSQFLRTLGVLVNAAQNAPEWLAVVAPDALELAITVGTRPVSQHEGKDVDDDGDEANKETGSKEASVLSGALELALVVLDGALEVDGGQSLSLEHTHLLLAANEWAGKVFGLLEKGVKVEGEGGVHEVKLRSVAAGVLLKVDEIMSRWKRSMVDYM